MENTLTSRALFDLDENYKQIREKIARAALESGRSEKDITFLAATKTVDAERINHAIGLGLDAVGENRVQELLAKFDSLRLEQNGKFCRSEFIGHLQTNKVRQIIDKVSLIHSVDSLRLAEEISRQAGNHGKTMEILLEVNIGREENKSGVFPEMVEELAGEISGLPHVKVTGLMAIPPICETKSEVREYFSKMRQLFIDIGSKNIDNISMEHLSMGMSGDFEEAILEGATTVRIGSSLFGARDYSKA